MQEQILNELTIIKLYLAKLTGSSALPPDEQFTNEVLDKAAKEFQVMCMERGEWVKDSDISKIIKKAPYRAGNFIRENFSFVNFFKRGHDYYFNREDLTLLAKELKQRNVDLSRYIEFKEEQAKFEKARATVPKKNPKSKPFKLPKDAKNVPESPRVLPSADAVRQELKTLKQTFLQNKYEEYIDIYNGSFAMIKHIYYFEKYMEPGLKRQLHKWCSSFNEANTLIVDITKKKEKFIPVSEENMISL
ncbi:MAG: hypothetical protein V4539_08585 [Bacteroidota bacterium]